MNKLVRVLLLAGVVATILMGCGADVRQTQSDEEVVAERAKERWEHLINKRIARAYEYLSPGSKEIQSLEFYILRTGRSVLDWREATVRSVSCDRPQVCKLDVHIKAMASNPVPRGGPVPVSRTLTETWVKSGDAWYFVPSELQ